ncbi:hypothetical protein H9L39_02172 [Fusarium oxysporum f. sp. albedinis]|nr:hypothetical protein H9L39_02172 [Fusarium oxysporum f. sp. albedinis]
MDSVKRARLEQIGWESLWYSLQSRRKIVLNKCNERLVVVLGSRGALGYLRHSVFATQVVKSGEEGDLSIRGCGAGKCHVGRVVSTKWKVEIGGTGVYSLARCWILQLVLENIPNASKLTAGVDVHVCKLRSRWRLDTRRSGSTVQGKNWLIVLDTIVRVESNRTNDELALVRDLALVELDHPDKLNHEDDGENNARFEENPTHFCSTCFLLNFCNGDTFASFGADAFVPDRVLFLLCCLLLESSLSSLWVVCYILDGIRLNIRHSLDSAEKIGEDVLQGKDSKDANAEPPGGSRKVIVAPSSRVSHNANTVVRHAIYNGRRTVDFDVTVVIKVEAAHADLVEEDLTSYVISALNVEDRKIVGVGALNPGLAAVVLELLVDLCHVVDAVKVFSCALAAGQTILNALEKRFSVGISGGEWSSSEDLPKSDERS